MPRCVFGPPQDFSVTLCRQEPASGLYVTQIAEKIAIFVNLWSEGTPPTTENTFECCPIDTLSEEYITS